MYIHVFGHISMWYSIVLRTLMVYARVCMCINRTVGEHYWLTIAFWVRAMIHHRLGGSIVLRA